MTATSPPPGAGRPAGGWSMPPWSTWTAAWYALGRRLLPIMAARWVFNGGSALALALGLVQ